MMAATKQLTMQKLIISTDRLISASEARKKFGQMLSEITENKGNYYVILENGHVTALLVHPEWLKEKQSEEFPNLEKLRQTWNRHTPEISKALASFKKMNPKDLPKFLK